MDSSWSLFCYLLHWRLKVSIYSWTSDKQWKMLSLIIIVFYRTDRDGILTKHKDLLYEM